MLMSSIERSAAAAAVASSLLLLVLLLCCCHPSIWSWAGQSARVIKK
jgi:hypothetical protein